jgi:KUP system potassium uptake protein
VALAGFFFSFDVAFLGANALKIEQGGWVPILIAGLVGILMTTWKRGRMILTAIVRENTLPMDLFLSDVARKRPTRVPGTAVFLTSDSSGAPPVLLHHLKHNKVLHEKVILMSIATVGIPHVEPEERVRCKELGENFYEVVAHYGFMESPDVPAALQLLGKVGDGKPVSVNALETSFYLGRETLIALRRSRRKNRPANTNVRRPSGTPDPGLPTMAYWRKRLFVFMTRNAQSASTFFGLPPNRVVELGAQIQF